MGLGAGLVRDVLAFTEVQARRPAPADPNLVSMLDLVSATMNELRDMQDIAEHVGAAAYAYTHGPRCGSRIGCYGATELNDIGKLMHWLGDALTDVETAVDKEVSRRVLVNNLDRETRLAMRAARVVESGDVNETATFIGELAALLADEMSG